MIRPVSDDQQSYSKRIQKSAIKRPKKCPCFGILLWLRSLFTESYTFLSRHPSEITEIFSRLCCQIALVILMMSELQLVGAFTLVSGHTDKHLKGYLSACY